MICTVCWGKGWTRGDGGEKVTCPACHGSGKVEQTNEEWFCGLSTEEKAKWFAGFLYAYGDRRTREDEILIRSETWLRWLKEKHE